MVALLRLARLRESRARRARISHLKRFQLRKSPRFRFRFFVFLEVSPRIRLPIYRTRLARCLAVMRARLMGGRPSLGMCRRAYFCPLPWSCSSSSCCFSLSTLAVRHISGVSVSVLPGRSLEVARLSRHPAMHLRREVLKVEHAALLLSHFLLPLLLTLLLARSIALVTGARSVNRAINRSIG